MNEEAYMSPFFRYSYTFNKDTGEVDVPEIFLLNKQLHKLGRLYPVSDFNVSLSINNANEISFNFSKYHGEEESKLYTKLKNRSIVFVQGLGCFELKVDETDNVDGVIKSVSGTSLGNSEMSQILATIEANTDDDILRDDYDRQFPTVLYRPYDNEEYIDSLDWGEYGNISVSDKKKKLKESSLLHRILSYAPHYQIGHIDESLWYVQREFSFSDQNIAEILQSVAEEIGCIFTYDTFLSDDGNAVRQINAFDLCYCKKCYNEIMSSGTGFKYLTTGKFRSVTNGICDNCGSSEFIYDYGDDTDIFLTTDNLTDEIQITPENEVKNCFKISGGDDLITATVQALNMSSSNKIVMFSEEQKDEMSSKLRNKLDKYNEEYSSMEGSFEEIATTEYNVIDLIQYLQSGKLPQLAEDTRDIQQEVAYVLNSIFEDYSCNFYISSYSSGESAYITHAYQSSSTSIKNLFTLYLDKGYSVSVKNGDLPSGLDDNNTKIKWNGIITIYETSDRYNNYADIHVLKDGETYTDPDGITYSDTYVEYGAITKSKSNYNLIEEYEDFVVNLAFGDTNTLEYKTYIEQFCEAKLATFNEEEYKNREEKDWSLYSYEMLKNYYDGYESCIGALDELYYTSSNAEKEIVTEIRDVYCFIQKQIGNQLSILENQLNALYEFYGVYPDQTDVGYKDYIKKGYQYNLNGLTDYISIIRNLADENSDYYIGTKPFACSVCGSSNVGVAIDENDKKYNYCKNCSNHDQDKITTYGDVAKDIINFIDNYSALRVERDLSLEYIGNNTYYSYLSPSIQSYTIEESIDSNSTGYILCSETNNVEPFFTGKTTHCVFRSMSRKSYTCYIVENISNYELSVTLNHYETNQLFKEYTIEPHGISKIQTDGYDVQLEIQALGQPNVGNCIINVYKIYDTAGESVNIYPVTEERDYKGKHIWCSEQAYNNIDVFYTSSSIDSISNERNRLIDKFTMRNYFGEELYIELMTHIREDKYENSNYTSENCLTNTQLVQKSKELLTKAKNELAKACMQQYAVSSTIYAIVMTKYRNWFDNTQSADDNEIRVKLYDEYENFKLGNWIRARIDNKNYKGQDPDNGFYKLRLIGIQLSFDNIDNTTVEFSNVEKNVHGTTSDVRSIISQANTMTSSYSYVATQAEQGELAGRKIDNIIQNGVDSALSAVKAGENQEIMMDRHGILLRKYIPETDSYSKYQTWLIHRNIVMTNDNWETSSLAIGYGRLPDEADENGVITPRYTNGVWADALVGSLLAGKKLKIYGGADENGNNDASVVIDENGIKVERGYLCIANDNYSVEIDPNNDGVNTLDDYLFAIRKKDSQSPVMGVTNDGDGYFNGNIASSSITSSSITCGDYFSVTPSGTLTAKNGSIGGWEITDANIYNMNDGTICSIANETTSCTPGFTTGSYEFHPAYTITAGKTIWNLFKTKQFQFDEGEFTTAYRYADASCDGFYCTNCNLGANYLFAADTRTSTVTIGGTVNIKGVAKFYDSLRLQASDTDYAEISVSALDNTAANTYILVKSSMSVLNRLQVGYSDESILPSNTFTVNGTSWIQGASYTNGGTAVTSDKNKKNSIASPSDDYIKLFDALQFKQFKYNDGSSDRLHLGVIAQELEEAMNKVGISSQDFGGLVIDEQDNYFVRYDEINVLTALKVKQLENRISELEEKIKDMEGGV